MSYNKYPKEMKEAIMARMLEGDETVTDIQRDTGVGINTLYRWRDQAKHQKGLSATTKYKNADKWSSRIISATKKRRKSREIKRKENRVG